jgi:hypothetical protein
MVTLRNFPRRKVPAKAWEPSISMKQKMHVESKPRRDLIELNAEMLDNMQIFDEAQEEIKCK